MRRRRPLLVALALIALTMGTIAHGAEFSGFPKLSPLYPRPPYLIVGTDHLIVLYEADENAIRELMPPGVEIADNILGLNMYTAKDLVGAGPYTSTYIWANVKGFDSSDGTPGRVMAYGWYGPNDSVPALPREVMGFPVKLGVTRLDRDGAGIRALLNRNGKDLVEARIAVKGDAAPANGLLTYPILRQVPAARATQTALSELVVHRITYRGEVAPAEPISVEFMVGDKDPLAKLRPKKLVGAFHFKGEAIALGYTDLGYTDRGEDDAVSPCSRGSGAAVLQG
jgi:acetoacetate decarboxylase